jgi:hypothetical protein
MPHCAARAAPARSASATAASAARAMVQGGAGVSARGESGAAVSAMANGRRRALLVRDPDGRGRCGGRRQPACATAPLEALKALT